MVIIDEKSNHLFKDDQNYCLCLMFVHTANIFILKPLQKMKTLLRVNFLHHILPARCSGMPKIVCAVYFTFLCIFNIIHYCGHPPF